MHDCKKPKQSKQKTKGITKWKNMPNLKQLLQMK